MNWLVLLLALSLTGCYEMLPPAPQAQQVTFKLVWPWDSSVIYLAGDRVTMPEFIPGGPIYESLKDKNIGIQPPSLVAGTDRQTYYSSPSTGWENWWKWVAAQQ
jgi:hypothetical protein